MTPKIYDLHLPVVVDRSSKFASVVLLLLIQLAANSRKVTWSILHMYKRVSHDLGQSSNESGILRSICVTQVSIQFSIHFVLIGDSTHQL